MFDKKMKRLLSHDWINIDIIYLVDYVIVSLFDLR